MARSASPSPAAGTPAAPPRVTADHVRALAAPGRRSVLVLTGGRLAVVAPDDVLPLAGTDAGCRVLATRGDLLDYHPDLRVSAASGHVVGPLVAVATDIARHLNDDLAAIADPAGTR